MVFVKKMVCEGFKSFRRKTIINFDKGFTGIVGANGSGKSNIIDAFVFVLGELSAKTLRANNIKDLISNGGNGLSQSETASVEIIFDNSDKVIPVDTPELSVLRKIDREGNGIYKLNGKKSTRKEVMEMLDLAGMLPNSSNMIMQGELFRLITMNVTERRQLVEDIAGIASFNDKRNSADQELTKVQTNLGQITLLLNEVKTQLDQLEKEKNDALTYLEFVNQEKIHKNALYLLRINNTKKSLEQMVADRILAEKEIARIHELEEKTRQIIDGFQIKLSDLNLKIRAVEDSELAQLSGNISKLKDHITEVKSSLKYGKKNLLETETEILSLKERLNALDGKESQLNSEIDRLKMRKEELVGIIKTKSDEITQLESHLTEIDAQFIKVKESAKELTAQINSVKEQKNRKETEIKVLENQIGSLQSQTQKLEQNIRQNHKDMDILNQELSKLKTEYAIAVERAGGEECAKDNIERMIKSCEQKTVALQQEQKHLNAESKQKHADLVELQSKIKVYKQMNAGNAAVEAILKLKRSGQIPGIFGTIAELGSAESMYATALEMAAGGKFNWVVVDHQFTAEKCIQYLKENSIGRATFIPLSAVQVSSNDYHIPENSNIHGRAIDLITFDPLVKKAFEFVFGRCVIVEDIRTANELRLPVKRVTMDGDVVESSNVMTGGQRSRPTGQGFKSSEASEISVLEDAYAAIQSRLESNDMEIKSLQNKIGELYRKKISGDKESQKINEKITVCQAKIDRVQIDIHKYEQEISELQKSAEELVKQKRNLQFEHQQIQEQLSKLLDQEKTFQSQLDSSEESGIKKQLRVLEDELKRTNKESNNLDIEFTKKNTMLSETVINKRQDFKQQITEKEAFCLKSKTTLEDSTHTLQEEEIQLQSLESKLAQKNAVLSQFLDEKKQLLMEISQAKTNIAQMSNDLHPLQLKINTIQLKSNEYENKIGEWKCQILPNVDVSESEMSRSEQDHQSILEKLVLDKTNLGPVNLKAIEKFKEIDTRFHELEVKNEQIIEEREAILEFIQALESEKKKVFMNTFNNINKNFGYIFSRLSPGGEAKLELENLEDPFAGGIEMMARPGEKKWCLTQAMSGGEKTLTIIALILGIQMHVPSPYYVLDEIDAALDDVNAALVADLIKELSGRSQFVIITHRDVTMARVDQLLGVSNREGVSNVVNLSIRNVLKELSKNQNQNQPQSTNHDSKPNPTLEIPQ